MSHTIKTNTKDRIQVWWISNSDASGTIELMNVIEDKRVISNIYLRFEDIKQYLDYCGYEVKEKD